MAKLRFAGIRKISLIIEKSPNVTIDCWSTKREDGTPGGIATEDCDIAIDCYNLDETIEVGQTSIVKNPYNSETGPEGILYRVKFNVM